MSLTPEQLDNWFTYHAPTEETAPKYAAIREAECNAADLCAWLDVCIDDRLAPGSTFHDRVNATGRDFTVAIDGHAPDSADKSAAIRCVRIACNALNEAGAAMIAYSEGRAPRPSTEWLARLNGIARDQLVFARWQATRAIACGGK